MGGKLLSICLVDFYTFKWKGYATELPIKKRVNNFVAEVPSETSDIASYPTTTRRFQSCRWNWKRRRCGCSCVSEEDESTCRKQKNWCLGRRTVLKRTNFYANLYFCWLRITIRFSSFQSTGSLIQIMALLNIWIFKSAMIQIRTDPNKRSMAGNVKIELETSSHTFGAKNVCNCNSSVIENCGSSSTQFWMNCPIFLHLGI